MATRTRRGATAAAATRACCSSTERTVPLSAVPWPAARSSSADSACAQAQSLDQPAPQLRSVVVAFQRKVNRSLEVAARISQVVSRTTMHHDVNRMTLVDQQGNGIGELNLSAD